MGLLGFKSEGDREEEGSETGLHVEGLSAGYGPLEVLHGVSFHVGAGEAVAVLGANGAGKTTLLRTISGLHPLSEGRISWNGRTIGGQRPDIIVSTGLAQVPEGRQVFAAQTVGDNLLLGGRLRSDPEGLAADWEYVLGVFPALADRLHEPAGNLSGGQQGMLAIARALMSRPSLLMLDEPTLGLAPRLVDEFGELLRRLGTDRDMGLLLVEQDALLALELTQRAYVLQHGTIVAEEESKELLSGTDLAEAYLGGR